MLELKITKAEREGGGVTLLASALYLSEQHIVRLASIGSGAHEL